VGFAALAMFALMTQESRKSSAVAVCRPEIDVLSRKHG
jgi:hypothetical protein